MSTSHLFPVLCTCCAAILTKPVFVKGVPYGSSCVKKHFTSDVKVIKTKNVCHSFKFTSVSKLGTVLTATEIKELANTNLVSATIELEGVEYKVFPEAITNDSVVVQVTSEFNKMSGNTDFFVGGSKKLYNAIYK